MYEFKLNGEIIKLEEDKNLIEYLREDARMTSVKNGCGEGACGACMVLVDGKAMRACILSIAKVNGKEVLTVEGISEREKIYMPGHLQMQEQFNVAFVFREWL